MKSTFTLLCFLGGLMTVQGQSSTQVDLQLNKIENIDYQPVDSPINIFDGNRSVTVTGTMTASERSGVVNSGPVFPFAIPANDDCVNATSLTIDAACINGTNKEATVQAGENTSCQGAVTKTVWYKFVATSTSLFVEVERTASSGCYLSSAVYSGGCLPSTSLSCEDAAGGPNLNIHNLTGLTVGATYYIQVSYTGGAFCGNNGNAGTGADFCIKVGRPQICGTCSNPCGPVCVFASTPTVAQVTSTCTRYDLKSRLNAGQSRTQCYTFTAVAASFSLQMIINSVGCSGGNVTAFTWQLYPSNCSGVVQSGNLSNLNATGLTIGASYVICYTWTAACQHNSVYPYIVATSPLPIELLHFDGDARDNSILLKWITASEINNQYFSIQRSNDGFDFHEIGRLNGAGNSNNQTQYSYVDSKPMPGMNYYKLVQYDFDNTSTSSDVIALRLNENYNVSIDKNPVTDVMTLTYDSDEEAELIINIHNQYGKKVILKSVSFTTGRHKFAIPVESLSSGVYHLNIEGAGKSTWLKFLKM